MNSLAIPPEGLALDSPELFSLLMSPAKIEYMEKRDKIVAAYHEAGHAVVALELGFNVVMVTIERNQNMPSFGEYAWHGKCLWRGDASKMRIATPAISVAGEVAVLMMDDGWDAEKPWMLGPEDFNEVDAKSLTYDNVVMALRDAGEILTERWARVEAFAEELLKHEYMTNGMAAEIIESEVKP